MGENVKCSDAGELGQLVKTEDLNSPPTMGSKLPRSPVQNGAQSLPPIFSRAVLKSRFVTSICGPGQTSPQPTEWMQNLALLNPYLRFADRAESSLDAQTRPYVVTRKPANQISRSGR